MTKTTIKWTKNKCSLEASKFKTRRQFKVNSGSAYNSALRYGWLDEICCHMPANNKRAKWYWTFERCKTEAIKYQTRSEFKTGSGGAYDSAQINQWLDEICGHMTNKYKKSGFWTKENCQAEALKYTSRKEFKSKAGGAYTRATKSGWLKEITSHMPSPYKELKKCLYEVYFEKSDTYYIGLTNNFNRRVIEHTKGKSDSSTTYSTSVFDHINATGETPQFSQISEYMDADLASDEEQRLITQYQLKGKSLLNRNIGGSLGGGWIKWTKKTIQTEALKYDTRTVFLNNAPGAYEAAVKRGWLQEVCSHMKTFSKPMGHWTKENCRIEAAKYTSKKEFKSKSSGAYQAASKHGWLDEICHYPNAKRKPNGYWTKDRCELEAKNHKTRGEFQNASPQAYMAAQRAKWLDLICSHMVSPQKPNGYWTKDRCQEEALRYTTRSKFAKCSSSAYSKAKKEKWLDDICTHMISRQKPHGYWNKERCHEEALKYQARALFRDGSPSAYDAAKNKKWLDEICAHMSKSKPK